MTDPNPSAFEEKAREIAKSYMLNQQALMSYDGHVNWLSAAIAKALEEEREEALVVVYSKDERIASLEATVAKAFLRCQALEEALREAGEAMDFYLGEKKCATFADAGELLQRAKSVRMQIMNLCHSGPVPGGETSSAAPPQSTDGEARCDCHLHENQVCDICQGVAR